MPSIVGGRQHLLRLVHIRSVACVAVLLAACFVLPASVSAYQEPNTLSGTGCSYCHPTRWVDPPGYFEVERRPVAGGDCDACHVPYARDVWTGPHGAYTTTSRKCAACHSVHAAEEDGIKLLPGATIQASCLSCHDGTAGNGVYGTIEARGGAPGARHRCEVTDVVPGGDASGGGSAVRMFRGDGNLTCTDCHSPHGTDLVAPFKGDRRRVRGDNPAPVTSRLLKKSPTGAASPVPQYGSDWCLACHAGRSSGGAVHNHPVDSLASRVDPFDYSNVAILDSEGPTGGTVLGPLGGVPFPGSGHWLPEAANSGNRGYLMPYPRSPEQADHYPICQQCHEDSRQVGTLSADGSTAEAAGASIAAADGVVWDGGSGSWVPSPDNPRFQNFPHETENARMTVEPADDLCTNCHPAARLP